MAWEWGHRDWASRKPGFFAGGPTLRREAGKVHRDGPGLRRVVLPPRSAMDG